MTRFYSGIIAVCTAGLVLWAGAGACQGQSTGVLREVWTEAGGTSVSDLTSLPSFPAQPSQESLLTNFFEAPVDWGDSYGTRLRALLSPPLTGSYRFAIASDDGGVLYLSTDETPAAKIQIASVSAWSSSREYLKEAGQISAPVLLTNGRRYYIEAMQKEGGGGDNLAVAWQKPGDAAIANNNEPIPASYCIPYGLTAPLITGQPANLTVVEGGTAVFSVQLGRFLGSVFQWKRNGTNLTGQTASSYVLAPVSLADQGAAFSCRVTNSYGQTNTATAILSVTPDVTRPALLSAGSLGEGDVVTLVFSEALDPLTATQSANYSINNGVTVQRAVFGVDAQTIQLSTTPLSYGVRYTVTVNALRDRAATPNTVLSNSQRSFQLSFVPLDASLVRGASEALGPCSRRTGLVITEIMFHPAARADGRNTQFIELYNSSPWQEDLSGYRISGSVGYTFAPGAVIAGRGFLVVAPSPADVQAAQGVAGVLGPLDAGQTLPKDSGTLRVRNPQDAILLEIDYSSDWPYPAAAAGAGHSLVLARPSLGERDPAAWAASDRIGGSPGSNDTAGVNLQRAVVINEVLARALPPQEGFVELFNYATNSVNIGACVLTDDPQTNRFVFPVGTTIAAGGFLALTESQLGFGLKASGETVYFKNAAGTRVLDAVRFPAQETGVAWGRAPDGAADLSRLSGPTPGANNARPRVPDVGINEIMYAPISGNSDDEYVELFNRSASAVDLSLWHVRGGISFDLPAGVALPAGGYLVVAKNPTNLMARYPLLSAANTLGAYSGTLGDSGDRIALTRPAASAETNALGLWVTNQVYVVENEVVYETGGRWGRWSREGGSSLELVDAHSDTRRAPNWADSDETAKSSWVTVTATGVLDNGNTDASSLQIQLLGEGECLVDAVSVTIQGGANLVPNSDFESGTAGWYFQGNHVRSSLESGQGYASSKSLHVRSSGRGDPGANRIRIALSSTPAAGQTCTISARVRWLAGWPEILLRLHGGWMEATGNILTSRNFGTPGARNSRAAANSGPALFDVTHRPVVPGPGQAVTVIARAQDPDGLSSLVLRYRVDPATNLTTVPMVNNGAGLFSAILPGQPDGTVVPFHLAAADNAATPAASFFPSDAPARECLARWGDPVPGEQFTTHRLWISQRVMAEWSAAEKLSNEPRDCTFVYGTNRVVYNMGAYFQGSPWHAPGFNTPVGNQCDYAVVFPGDNRLLNDKTIHWVMPGNGCCDGTLQREQTAYWLANQVGCPLTYRRHINLFVNGQRRGSTLVEDTQRPDGDLTDEWYPDSPNGDLYKLQIWYEYDDAASSFSAIGFSLGNFTTAGGAKKLARYRANWAKRAIQDSASNYTNVYALVDAANTAQTGGAYTALIRSQVDIDNWFRTLAVEKIVGNGDSWGNGGGQNMYAYKPPGDSWKLLIWDIDFAFSSGSTTDGLFGFGDSPLQRMADHPPFRRAYWRALYDLAAGPMRPERSNPLLDSRYNAFVAAGFGTESPESIKSYMAGRRAYVLEQLATVQAPLDITSNNGQSFSTNRGTITLTGRAPVPVAVLTINGIAYPVVWTTITNWSVTLPLAGGLNTLTVQGWDSQGGAAGMAALTITNTLPFERPQDCVKINEIMFDPRAPGAEYVELYNTSAVTTFDLSGWRFNGIDYTFPPATFLSPRAFLVLARDRAAFAAAYGSNVTVFAEYAGNLQAGGETLTVLQPSTGPAGESVADKARYSATPPWPTNTAGTGSSLQRVDAAQDSARPGNWASAAAALDPVVWRFASVTASNSTDPRVFIFLNGAGDVYLDDLSFVLGSAPAAGFNYVRGGDLESPLTNNFIVGANLSNSVLSATVRHGGNSSARVISTAPGGSLTTSIYQSMQGLPAGRQTCTLSFWYRYGSAGQTLTVRLPSSLLRVDVSVTPSNAPAGLFATPGATNNVAAALPAFPPLWINEVQPVNLSGLADATGQPKPWIELVNTSATNVALEGLFLSPDPLAPARWAFPAGAILRPGEFRIVFADGQPGLTTAAEWHTDFALAAGQGMVLLSQASLGDPRVLDYVAYNLRVPGRSYGSFPDGQPFDRQEFFQATPGGTNNPVLPPVLLYINEWMANNDHGTTDPADNDHDDWFELYNPDTNAVSLSGYYLTDNLTNKLQFRVPDGYYIPARGWLLVWADGETSQNSPERPELHASFKLDAGGEAIGVFTPAGQVLDAVTFGSQPADVSQGRFPDGASTVMTLSTVTPGTANVIRLPNHPPRLAPIADAVVVEERMLAFTVSASDADAPGQTLAYRLDPPVPPGASLDPQTGLFTWRPARAQAPSTNVFVVRVTDDGDPALGDQWSFQVVVLPLPRLSHVVLDGSQLRFSCASYPGRHYQVQSSDDLRPGSWGNQGDPVEAAEALLNVVQQVDGRPQRFYRLIQTD